MAAKTRDQQRVVVEIREWFKPKEYDRAAELTPFQWATEVFLRLGMDRVLTDPTETDAEDLALSDEMMRQLMQSQLFDLAKPLALPAVMQVSDPRLLAFAASQGSATDQSLGALLVVNQHATDEDLRIDFERWLEARQVRAPAEGANPGGDKGSHRSTAVWVRNGVLPYADLRLWVKWKNLTDPRQVTKLSEATYCHLLYGTPLKRDGEKSVRLSAYRSTMDHYKLLFTDDMVRALMWQRNPGQAPSY